MSWTVGLFIYNLSLCWDVHVFVCGCACVLACMSSTPHHMFHFDTGFQIFVYTVGLLQKMTFLCKRPLEIMLSSADKLIPHEIREWNGAKLQIPGPRFSRNFTTATLLLLCPGHLGNTENLKSETSSFGVLDEGEHASGASHVFHPWPAFRLVTCAPWKGLSSRGREITSWRPAWAAERAHCQPGSLVRDSVSKHKERTREWLSGKACA